MMKKKMIKRAGVAVLSMAMLLSMGAVGGLTASAASNVSVTLPSTVTGAKYDIYKVAGSTESGSNYVYSAVETGFGDSVSAVASSLKGTTANKMIYDMNDSELNELARELEEEVADNSIAATKTNQTGSTTLNSGYYLMLTTGVTGTVQPILFEVKGATVTLSTPKASPVSLDKGIMSSDGVIRGEEGTNGTYTLGATNAAAGIGTVVDYKIITDIPNYRDGITPEDLEADYVVTDTASAGLTFLNGQTNVTVRGNTVSKTGEIAVGIDNDADGEVDFQLEIEDDYELDITGQVMTVTLHKGNVVEYKGERLVITYSAAVNDSALISDESTDRANPNTATLNFDNYYEGGGAGLNDGDEPSDTNNVYTAKIDFTKSFSDNPASTPAATITLFKEGATAGTYDITVDTFTTGAAKTKEFKGLSEGSYRLSETTTPAGYTTAANIDFSIDADPDKAEATHVFTFSGLGANGSNDATMANVLRDSLPGTGGIGTYIFTFGGAAVVLFAGFMFVLYMRKRRTEEE